MSFVTVNELAGMCGITKAGILYHISESHIEVAKRIGYNKKILFRRGDAIEFARLHSRGNFPVGGTRICPQGFVTITQLAERIHLSYGSIRRYVSIGEIRAEMQPNNFYIISNDEADAFVSRYDAGYYAPGSRKGKSRNFYKTKKHTRTLIIRVSLNSEDWSKILDLTPERRGEILMEHCK